MGLIFGFWHKNCQSVRQVCEQLKEESISPQRELLLGLNDELLLGIDRGVDDISKEGTASLGQLHAVFSGRIINFRSLCDEFQLDASQTNYAKLFLAIYSQKKKSAVSLINGLFSVAVWDESSKEVHLFSDRIGGLQGFYYSSSQNSFSFGNQLPTVLQLTDSPRRLDTTALTTFFTQGYVLPPYTFLENVKKNWPGECVTFDANTGQVKREFVDPLPFAQSHSHTGSVEEFEDVLEKAIRDLSLDEPNHAFLLSGGIDSSSIVALAAKESSEPLNTFSAAFPGTVFDESPYALKVAEKYGCRSNIINMTKIDSMKQLPEIIWFHNEPTIDFSCLPTYGIFSHVRSYFPSVFGGDGPDHFFGRYSTIAAKQAVSFLRPLYGLAYGLTHKDIFRRLQWGASRSLTESYFGLFSIPAWGTNNIDHIHTLFTDSVSREIYPLDSLLPGDLNKKGNYEELFHKTTFFDSLVDGTFGVFKKVGCMSHATGLKLNLPFMDRRVQDYIFALPREQRIHGGWLNAYRSKSDTKYLLKFGMGPKVLPEDVITKNKGGFTPPLVDWLKHHICPFPAEKILSPGLLEANLFQPSTVNRILQEHRNDVRNWTTILFMILSFDLWFRYIVQENHFTPPKDDYFELLAKQGVNATSD